MMHIYAGGVMQYMHITCTGQINLSPAFLCVWSSWLPLLPGEPQNFLLSACAWVFLTNLLCPLLSSQPPVSLFYPETSCVGNDVGYCLCGGWKCIQVQVTRDRQAGWRQAVTDRQAVEGVNSELRKRSLNWHVRKVNVLGWSVGQIKKVFILGIC